MSRKKESTAYETQRLLLNQVRHRILQYINHHGNVTVREMGDALRDIPQATLYRQVKLLSENGLIRVCGERQVRGTLEHTYTLDGRLTDDIASANGDTSVQFTLLSIAQDFADYYSGKDADPGRDMLDVSSTPMLLSDEEFAEYMAGVKDLTSRYMGNRPSSERRARRVTLISSPT